MKKTRMILIGVLIVSVVVAAFSFFALEKTPKNSENIGRIDKAELTYKRGKSFVRTGEHDKAIGAFFILINKYPNSEYAEESIKDLISIYLNKGEDDKAKYYYKRLLKNFPEAEGISQIRDLLEEINMKNLFSSVKTEDSIEYEVQVGDSLFVIAKRFSTTIDLIKKVNGLKTDVIRLGRKLKIIVSKFSIFIDKSENILILSKDGEWVKTYKISTGKDNRTPVGKFKIEEKMVKPVWYKVGAVVSADSEEYELGERWMGLSVEGYGIHGTSDETTIGGQVTQGCIRMYNADVIELFGIVPSGTEVEIVD